MLQWENTDQFGNLKVAVSSVMSLDEIDQDLKEMAKAVFDQHGEDVKFSVDVAYAEISAPRGDQVSHVLNLPFLSDLVASGADREHLRKNLTERLEAIIGNDATVVGPWD